MSPVFRDDVNVYPDGSVIATVLAKIRTIRKVQANGGHDDVVFQDIAMDYVLKACISGHVPWEWVVASVKFTLRTTYTQTVYK